MLLGRRVDRPAVDVVAMRDELVAVDDRSSKSLTCVRAEESSCALNGIRVADETRSDTRVSFCRHGCRGLEGSGWQWHCLRYSASSAHS